MRVTRFIESKNSMVIDRAVTSNPRNIVAAKILPF